MQRASHPECPSPGVTEHSGGVDTNLPRQRARPTLRVSDVGWCPCLQAIGLSLTSCFWHEVLYYPCFYYQYTKQIACLRLQKILSITKALSWFFIQLLFIYLFIGFSIFYWLHWVLTPASAADLGKIEDWHNSSHSQQGERLQSISHSSAPQPHSSFAESSVSVPKNSLWLYRRVYKLGSHHLLSPPQARASHSKASYTLL